MPMRRSASAKGAMSRAEMQRTLEECGLPADEVMDLISSATSGAERRSPGAVPYDDGDESASFLTGVLCGGGPGLGWSTGGLRTEGRSGAGVWLHRGAVGRGAAPENRSRSDDSGSEEEVGGASDDFERELLALSSFGEPFADAAAAPPAAPTRPYDARPGSQTHHSRHRGTSETDQREAGLLSRSDATPVCSGSRPASGFFKTQVRGATPTTSATASAGLMGAAAATQPRSAGRRASNALEYASALEERHAARHSLQPAGAPLPGGGSVGRSARSKAAVPDHLAEAASARAAALARECIDTSRRLGSEMEALRSRVADSEAAAGLFFDEMARRIDEIGGEVSDELLYGDPLAGLDPRLRALLEGGGAMLGGGDRSMGAQQVV